MAPRELEVFPGVSPWEKEKAEAWCLQEKDFIVGSKKLSEYLVGKTRVQKMMTTPEPGLFDFTYLSLLI